jgi:uncharacterized protein with FMN-binding domain
LRTEPARRSARSTTGPAPLTLPPRRAVLTILGTALGLILLFSFKTPDSPSDSTGPLAAALGTPLPGATSQPIIRGTPRPGVIGGASPSPTASAQPPANGKEQVDGDVVGTRFGDVQVRLVESGGKIVDIQALQLPFDRSRSRQISQYSEPILHDEALQAQSANIDTVSGATYTSLAYSKSLQSALDRVGG